MVLLVVLSGAWQYRVQIRDGLAPALAGAELWVRGRVASLTVNGADYRQFLFRPSRAQAELAGLPSLIRVRWYQAPVEPRPGEPWRLKLRLSPPRALVNFHGFDREQALFSNGIGALASVLDAQPLRWSGPPVFGIDHTRAEVRDRIGEWLPTGPGRALVLSLAIADRGELDRNTWDLLRSTGTGHLVAISGLHVGLAAVAGFWLMRLLLLLCPAASGRGRRSFLICCAGAMLVASAYGALAGFPVSTVRALVMLVVALGMVAARRGSGTLRPWLLALLAVTAINPFSPLTAGFWLSFGAVLALIAFFAPRGRAGSRWSILPRAQAAVMVVMLPLAAFWFQSGSWLAFPVNLLAIPWVSFVSVPLVLAGTALLPLPVLAQPVLELAWWSCAALHEFLESMTAIENGRRWMTPATGLWTAVLALGGGLLLLLPRGLAPRWLGGCLLAVMLLPRAAALREGEYSVELLDVGQGQAVVVRTRDHAMLYDTGPGDGRGWSLFGSVIAPTLAAYGNGPPDVVAVSHADLDHAGGLADLRTRFEDIDLRFNHEGSGDGSCVQGQSWTWDGVTFRVLHPSPWLPYLGNDSSCVVSIDNGRHRSLLSGDISTVVEDRLAEELQKHHLITVPHHGSSSSSGSALLAATRPVWAVVSAGYGNRFGFPRSEVVERYRRHGVDVISTIDCGGVRVLYTQAPNPLLESARLARNRPWRWHAGKPCMATSDHAMYHLSRLGSKR